VVGEHDKVPLLRKFLLLFWRSKLVFLYYLVLSRQVNKPAHQSQGFSKVFSFPPTYPEETTILGTPQASAKGNRVRGTMKAAALCTPALL